MANVFLSYDRDDRPVAAKVAGALETAGHSVWWDRNIRGGAEFSQEIDKALTAADAVVVLWSINSIASPWVRDEAAVGRDKARLVPVRINECIPPLGFRQFHTVDLRTGRKRLAAIGEVDQAIRALDGSGARDSPASERPTTRRNLLIAGGAATLAVAGGGGAYWYRQSNRKEVPLEVAPMLLQAKQLMNQNTREGQYQAIGLYRRVVQTAPDYADGWGWYGYAMGVVSHYRERAEALGWRVKAEKAGRRALELDSDSAFGELALSVALPFVGFWSQREQHLLRAIDIRPDEDEFRLIMGVAMEFAGRSTDALESFAKVKHKPLTPAEYTNYIRALWSAGRLPELNQAIKDAASLYPSQASIWITRLHIATFSGDVGAVDSLTRDATSRPSGVNAAAIAEYLRQVRAVQSKDPGEADAIVASEKKKAQVSATQTDSSIRIASALGRLDDAFALAAAYFFGRPSDIPDFPNARGGPSRDQRQTRFLFEPVTKPMRADPRFEPLVKELGFDRYWRESLHPPDYRKVPGL